MVIKFTVMYRGVFHLLKWINHCFRINFIGSFTTSTIFIKYSICIIVFNKQLLIFFFTQINTMLINYKIFENKY